MLRQHNFLLLLFVLMERLPASQGALYHWLQRVRRSCSLIAYTFLMPYSNNISFSDNYWLRRLALDENHVRLLSVTVHYLRLVYCRWHLLVGCFYCPH